MTTGQQILAALEPYKLKQEKPNEWRCNSPLRPGSDSHAFTLTMDQDGEHGAFIDHVSSETGSLYDLAARLAIEVDRQIVLSTKRAYAGRTDYAAAHGIPDTVLDQASWRETYYDKRLALSFPTRTGTRYRFLDGNKPTYKSPPAYERCWYGLNPVTIRRVADGQPLVICNGEISTVAGQHWGLAACCITGGEHEIPAALLDELKLTIGTSATVLIAMDCDATGQRVAIQNQQLLTRAGFTARAIDLKLGKGGDLADFGMLHVENLADKLKALPDLKPSAAPQTRRRWTITHADHMRSEPIVWLVKDVLAANTLTAIFGRSGEGKSFYGLSLAHEVAQRLPVVYIAAEGAPGYPKRLAALRKHHARGNGNLYFCLGAVSMLDQGDLTEFITAIQEIHPALVVVDTLARTMLGGDENSTKDMNLYIDACNQIQNNITCTVLLIHHIGKSGITERGSSVLRGSCDMMIRISAEDDVINIECSKAKDDEPFATMYKKLLPIQIGQGEQSAVLVDAIKVLESPNDPISNMQRTILSVLDMPLYDDGETPAGIESFTGLNHGVTARALNTLLKREFIEKARPGVYRITTGGKFELSRSPDRSDRYDFTTDLEPAKKVTDLTDLDRSDRSGSVEQLTKLIDVPEKFIYQ